MLKSWISWLSAGLTALFFIVAPPVWMVHAVGHSHEVSVVSFGLFGDQGVFKREATGAAQVVAGRYEHGSVNVQYNSKKGDPNVLVITAADAFHPSFGCRDKAKWTYFGDAFFNVALRHAKSLQDAFVLARRLVRKHELREH